MLNKNNWVVASPAITAGGAAACLACLLWTDNTVTEKTDCVFCLRYMGAELLVPVITETYTETVWVDPIDVVNHVA